MPQKGTTNNPNGRPKGKPNRITKEVREYLRELIEKQLPQIKRDLRALEPKDRLLILEKLMQYVIPKQQPERAQQTDENKNPGQLIIEVIDNREQVDNFADEEDE